MLKNLKSLLVVALLCVCVGANLNFNIGEALTIDVPFTVAAGSQLEIAAN